MTGLMDITGRADGEPGGGPQRVGVAVIDLFTGIYASSPILAALHARHSTGEGQHIDMALLDVGMAILANQGAAFLATGTAPTRQDNSHPNLAPYRDFATQEGSMLLAMGNEWPVRALLPGRSHPEWAQDVRFASNTLRVRHRSERVSMMEAVTRTRSTLPGLRYCKAKPCRAGRSTPLPMPFPTRRCKRVGCVWCSNAMPVTPLPPLPVWRARCGW